MPSLHGSPLVLLIMENCRCVVCLESIPLHADLQIDNSDIRRMQDDPEGVSVANNLQPIELS
jgi:hypothetical protein